MTQEGPGPAGLRPPSGPRIRVADVEVFSVWTKIGAVTVIIEHFDLEIRHCLLHVDKDCERLVGFQSKTYLKPDGTRGFEPVLVFVSQDAKRAFGWAVFEQFDDHIANPPQQSNAIDELFTSPVIPLEDDCVRAH